MPVRPLEPGCRRPTELLPYRSNSHAVAGHGHLNGIAWTCHPKHLDANVRTSTIPWQLLEGAPVWIAERQSLMASSHAIPHHTRVWGASRLRSFSPAAPGPSWNSIMRATSKLQHVEVLHPPRADHPGMPVLNYEQGKVASPPMCADQADRVTGWPCPQDGLARAPYRLISYTRSERDTREPPSPDACLALAISENRPAGWTAGLLWQCCAPSRSFTHDARCV